MSKKSKKNTAWRWFSKYIRLKYADKNGLCECVTCGIVKPWPDMQAGHGITGRSNSVLFLEEVVRPQCYSCNVGKQGNMNIYVRKLIEWYGIDGYDELMKEKHKPVKYTEQDYIDIGNHYKKLFNDLND